MRKSYLPWDCLSEKEDKIFVRSRNLEEPRQIGSHQISHWDWALFACQRSKNWSALHLQAACLPCDTWSKGSVSSSVNVLECFSGLMVSTWAHTTPPALTDLCLVESLAPHLYFQAVCSLPWSHGVVGSQGSLYLLCLFLPHSSYTLFIWLLPSEIFFFCLLLMCVWGSLIYVNFPYQ